MTDETPMPKIAILGAGPIGLEAAIYGRYLGYPVTVLESGRVAEHVRNWGHVRMFSPFEMNRSPLGVAAIEAQDPDRRLPAGSELLTGDQWVADYLEPLAETDLVKPTLQTGVSVKSVGRSKLFKTDLVGDEHRAENPFWISCCDRDGKEFWVEAVAHIAIGQTCEPGRVDALPSSRAADDTAIGYRLNEREAAHQLEIINQAKCRWIEAHRT